MPILWYPWPQLWCHGGAIETGRKAGEGMRIFVLALMVAAVLVACGGIEDAVPTTASEDNALATCTTPVPPSCTGSEPYPEFRSADVVDANALLFQIFPRGCVELTDPGDYFKYSGDRWDFREFRFTLPASGPPELYLKVLRPNVQIMFAGGQSTPRNNTQYASGSGYSVIPPAGATSVTVSIGSYSQQGPLQPGEDWRSFTLFRDCGQ